MFNDDDFFLDDSELAQDNQMTIVDDAIYKSLDSMEKAITELKNNLKFNEQVDAMASLKILSMHLDSAIRLARIDEDNLSEEEVQEEIENVIKQTTELTFANINTVLPDEPDDSIDMSTLNPGDIDSGLDF